MAFVLLLLLSLVKYLWLAGYAHPVADDYCYAAKSAGSTYWAWSRSEWLHWNGRYTSNLLMIHGPLTWWGDMLIGYRLVPVLFLASTFLSAWFLLRRLTRHALSNREELLATLVFLLLYLNLMPDLGEGFYWYTGAATYQLGSMLLFVHLALLVPGPARGAGQGALLMLNVLLAVALVGMDEIHMLLMLCLHMVRTAWLFGRRRNGFGALVLLLAAVAGAVLMYSAPGNAVRGAMFADTHELGRSAGMSALQAFRFVGQWLLSPALLACGALYIPLHQVLRERIPGFRALLRLPAWLAVLLPFLLVVATTFPAYWNTGLLGQHRTINVACFLLVPLVFLNLAIALERGMLRKLSTWTPTPALRGSAMGLALLALNFTGNGLAVHADLWGGRAAAYDRVMTEREEQMRVAAEDPSVHARFIPQSKPPRTLPSYEGPYLLRDWMMQCQARFFGAEAGQVSLQTEQP
ncbi:MAG: hypothetical protein KBF80_09910 [Flavobacteriales bacterium]|nr:hypothetical protein [Flavobacteriales bacterium]